MFGKRKGRKQIMRKLTSWILTLAVLMSVLCVPALAAGQSERVDPRVTVAYGRGVVTVTLWALEDTTNGHITMSYDANELTLVNTDVNAAVYSVDSETAGQVELGYADTEAIPADSVLAVLEFTYVRTATSPDTTNIVVSVVRFNGEEELTESHSVTTRLNLAAATIVQPPATETPGEETPGEETPGEETPMVLSFIDVHQDDWFYDAVAFVTERGYFKGTSETTFSPDLLMSRAMFVTVLGRMHGVTVDHNTTAGFEDVVPGSWYAGYVKWASDNGIVKGTSATTFDPDDCASREQMATFLYRYAQYAGHDMTASDSVMNSFADAASVSVWAKDAMVWATFKGIINGTDRGLEPQLSATRSQAAQILMKFQTKD